MNFVFRGTQHRAEFLKKKLNKGRSHAIYRERKSQRESERERVCLRKCEREKVRKRERDFSCSNLGFCNDFTSLGG